MTPTAAHDAPARRPVADRRILITGGAGFIGGHLCRELVTRGARDIVVLDDLSTGNAANVAPFVSSGHVRLIRGTVCRAEDLSRAFAHEPNLVFHLAAAVGVRLIIERPVESIETNIKGTEMVLDRAAQTNATVLIASSSEIYGKSARVPFRETDDLVLGPTTAPRWSYACSKMIDEFLALAFHRSQAMPTVVMRFFNTVGPGQTGRYGMVVPRLVRQALDNAPLTVYGDGKQTRAFCHVSDTVHMVTELAERPEAAGRIFNVGNDEEISIHDLAKTIVARTGSTSTIKFIPFQEAYDKDFEDLARRVPDISSVSSLIGWRPSRGINTIVDDVMNFERAASR